MTLDLSRLPLCGVHDRDRLDPTGVEAGVHTATTPWALIVAALLSAGTPGDAGAEEPPRAAFVTTAGGEVRLQVDEPAAAAFELWVDGEEHEGAVF